MKRLDLAGCILVVLASTVLLAGKCGIAKAESPQSNAVLSQPKAWTTELAAATRSGDVLTKLSAIEELGAVNDPTAVPILIRIAQNDPSEEMRVKAVESLGHFDKPCPPAAIDPLAKILKSDKAKKVRVSVVRALGYSRTGAAIGPLAASLTDPEKEVRETAIYSLGLLVDEKANNEKIFLVLAKTLKEDPDPDVRATVNWALGHFDDVKALDVMVAALTDKSAAVRVGAAINLQSMSGYKKIKDDRIVPALIGALKDVSPGVRASAASTLGAYQARQAIDHLYPLLSDPVASVRGSAANTLKQLGVPEEQTKKEVRVADSLKEITRLAHDQDVYLQIEAAAALGTIKDPAAVDTLLAVLKENPEKSVREKIAYALSDYQGPKDTRAIEPLVKLLKEDPSEGVRRTAAAALNAFEDSRAVDARAEALRSDADESVRVAAAYALTDSKDSRAVGFLTKALDTEKSALVKVAILGGLGYSGDSAATSVLISTLQSDPAALVRAAAASGLGSSSGPHSSRAIEPLKTALKEDKFAIVRVKAAEVLNNGFKDPGLIDPLVEALLKDESEPVRAAAAESLASFKYEEAQAKKLVEPMLQAMSKDSSDKVREKAANVLAFIRAPQALEIFLVAAKRDPSNKVRESAADFLARVKDDRAGPVLMETLGRDHSAVARAKAADGLGYLGNSAATAALMKALKEDSSGEVRQNAARALGQLKDERSIDTLTAALSDKNESVRSAAASALSPLAPMAVERHGVVDGLVKCLKDDPYVDVRKSAANALTHYRDPRLLEPFLAALKDTDESVRRDAAEGLGYLGDERVIGQLVPLLDDKDETVREYAADSLKRLGVSDANIKSKGPVSGDAIGELINGAKSEDWSARYQAVEGLGGITVPRAREAFMDNLKNNPKPEIRESAANGLAHYEGIHDERITAALIAAVKTDTAADVHKAAASALHSLASKGYRSAQVVDVLFELLKDPDEFIRASAAEALGQGGFKEAIEPLMALLKDPKPRVREGARDALKKLGAAEEKVKSGGLSPRQVLDSYVAELSEFSIEPAEREKIIKMVLTMKEPPEIPEEARRFLAQGKIAAETAKEKKGFSEAVEKFRKASRLAPWWPAPYFDLGLAETKLRNFGEATSDLNLYLLAAPKASDAAAVKQKIFEIEYMQEKSRKAAEHIDRGAELNNSGRIDEAIAENQEAIRLDPEHPLAQANLGAAIVIKAHEADGRKDNDAARKLYEEAIPYLEEAIRLGNVDLRTYWRVGECYFRAFDNADKAIEYYKEGLKVDPTNTNAGDLHHTLGRRLMYSKGLYAEAFQELEMAQAVGLSANSRDQLEEDLRVCKNNLGGNSKR